MPTQTRKQAINCTAVDPVLSDVKAEGVKAFSDAKPKISYTKPLLLHSLALGAAWLSGSYLFALILNLGVFMNSFADVILGNLLNPPFQDNRKPSDGLTMVQGKVCPYWPAETLRGPKLMGIEYEDVEFQAESGETIRGWLMPGVASAGNGKIVRVIICSHGAGRDRRAWLRHMPFLLKAGYTCLAFDFRSHGVSDLAVGTKGRSPPASHASGIQVCLHKRFCLPSQHTFIL